MKFNDVPSFEVTELYPKNSDYCIVIPVLNEGDRIRRQLSEMSSFAGEIDIIMADGGSTDGSMDPAFLKEQRVRTLLVKTGPGALSAQLRMAFHYALEEGYEGVITIDGNNKDDPSRYTNILDKLRDGYDFVQGSRFIKGGISVNMPFSRWVAVRGIHAPVISMKSGFRYTDTTNGFRGHSRRYLTHPGVEPFRDVFSRYELLFYLSARAPKLGLKVCEVPVSRSYPKGKTPTKISAVKGNWGIIQNLYEIVTDKFDPPS